MTAEPNEDELNRAYQVGISSGLGVAAAILLDKATAYFRVGNRDCDELASRLRDISKELKKRGDEEHPGVPIPE